MGMITTRRTRYPLMESWSDLATSLLLVSVCSSSLEFWMARQQRLLGRRGWAVPHVLQVRQ